MLQEYGKHISKLMVFLFLFGLIMIPDEPVQADEMITVDEAIAKNNDGTQATVEGYIVGYVKSEQHVSRDDFYDDTNFAVAADPGETDTGKMVYVQIPKEFRFDFGLQSNPDMLDEMVEVTGDLEVYFRTNGLKGASYFTWSGEHKTREGAHNTDDIEGAIQIHDIQGKGHESPLKGQNVENVEGIVTYKYDIRGANYFHIQSPKDKYDGDPGTSEGIVVYTGKEADVDIGDFVRVSGTVDEYYIDGYDDRADTDLPVTQINARKDRGDGIDVLEQDVALPEPIKITSSDIPDVVIGENGFDDFDPEASAIDFWESMEGMRVEVDQFKAVAPQEHGDLVVVTDEFATGTRNGGIRLTEVGTNAQSIQFKLYPNDIASDFVVKTGDRFTEPVIGVVNYGFSNYKVYADLNEVKDVSEEGDTEPVMTDIVKDDDKLTVASYNVENFSANNSTNETPDEKAENIAKTFVKDMKSPDVVGVIEVQDNNGQEQGPNDADASQSYERLIDEIDDANGPEYDYVNIDPHYNEDGGASDGNIRVGFLYNPERVLLANGEEGTTDEAVAYENGSLTLNPGRVAPQADAFKGIRKSLAAQFKFHGKSVVVVANHLNAKMGDDPAFGQNQPPVRGSEDRRTEMAKILNSFVQDIQTDNPEENIIVIGDMNDVEFSSPIQTLQGGELTNLVEKVPEEKRYSYINQGNSQAIDHILVSNHLADTAKIDMVHVNADFAEMHGRASDHDPILAQLDLAADDAAEGINVFLLVGTILVVVSGTLCIFLSRI